MLRDVELESKEEDEKETSHHPEYLRGVHFEDIFDALTSDSLYGSEEEKNQQKVLDDALSCYETAAREGSADAKMRFVRLFEHVTKNSKYKINEHQKNLYQAYAKELFDNLIKLESPTAFDHYTLGVLMRMCSKDFVSLVEFKEAKTQQDFMDLGAQKILDAALQDEEEAQNLIISLYRESKCPEISGELINEVFLKLKERGDAFADIIEAQHQLELSIVARANYLLVDNHAGEAKRFYAQAACKGSFDGLLWDSSPEVLRTYSQVAESKVSAVPKIGLRSLKLVRLTLRDMKRLADLWWRFDKDEAMRWYVKALGIGGAYLAKQYERLIKKECEENLPLFFKHFYQLPGAQRKILREVPWISALIPVIKGPQTAYILTEKAEQDTKVEVKSSEACEEKKSHGHFSPQTLPPDITDIVMQCVPWGPHITKTYSIETVARENWWYDNLELLYLALNAEITRMGTFSGFEEWFRGKAYVEKSKAKAKDLKTYVEARLDGVDIRSVSDREGIYNSLSKDERLFKLLKRQSGFSLNFFAPRSFKNITSAIQSINQRRP